MLSYRFWLGFFVLAAGAWYDLRRQQNIPTWLLYGAILASIAINLATATPMLFIASLIGAMAVWLISYNLSRQGLLGDAEPDLFAFLVMLLPLNFGMVLVMLSLWMLAGLARNKFKPSKTKVPLIPYMLLGWLLSALLLG